MEARKIQFETVVGQDGTIRLPNVNPGERVEIIVLPLTDARKELPLNEFGGWAKGKIKILPGFDDPIPGMEDYS
jgi:hypothetical protein